MTALVMSGQAGAAFTAEMGTMKVSDEVLALETMALNPVKFLITPRFLALLITLPCWRFMSSWGTCIRKKLCLGKPFPVIGQHWL